MSKNRYHILWILILAAVLRFAQIDAPPVGRHAWRQSDTASVARNFHHNGYRLLYPEIDWETPGFVEMEFPIYPWTTSLLYSVGGESAALARSLAVLGSLVTIGFLYLLVLRILGRLAALWSAFFLAVLPSTLFFGRAIMPESWMLAATAAAVYWFLRWIDEDSWLFYWLALLATTLACLLKLTSLYLGLPLLWLAWRKWGPGSVRRWPLWLFAGLVTVPLVLWYGHGYRLGQESGASFHILTAAGADKWGTWSLLVDPAFYHRVFVGYLGERMLTWVGLPIFVVGIFLRRLSPRERLFDVWLLAVTVVLLLASGGSYQHDYYSLPLVLPAVVFMAKVYDRGWGSHWRWLAVLALLILILSGYRHLGALADEQQIGADLTMAKALAMETARDDLVISCNGANPVWLYNSDRRGWGRDCGRLDKAELHDLIQQGSRYLITRGRPLWTSTGQDRLGAYLDSYFEVVEDSETTFLVRLTSPTESEDHSWQTVLQDDFSKVTSLEDWSLAGGSWNLDHGSLIGTRVRRPAVAHTRATLPACYVCTVKLSLSLLRPPNQQIDTAQSQIFRGSGQPRSKASIRLWWQDQGTGVTVTLATHKGRIGLHQTENGVRLHSRTVDFPVVEGEPIDLELRSDGFEIELMVDGSTVLTTTNRLTTPLSGWLGLRPRLGSIQLDRIEVQVPTSSLSEPRPHPKP